MNKKSILYGRKSTENQQNEEFARKISEEMAKKAREDQSIAVKRGLRIKKIQEEEYKKAHTASVAMAIDSLLDYIVKTIEEKAKFHKAYIMWNSQSNGEESLLLAHEAEHEDLHMFFDLWEPIREALEESL